ncbi:cell wall metabolism sensor histidine kinase WalK [Falcatimonas sp. MSJ-15]|uniref:sensor histidine kinase n=1 Tax=Falcatimonas sp. MSJ-15 TaxID=2841515 RepID=UPI0020A20CE1|nr:HAMP domain-containing sensor histidine kinase [Falcatimonas sp. MSJ-15]
MKSRFQSGLKGKILIYVVQSFIITVMVEFFLILNIYFITSSDRNSQISLYSKSYGEKLPFEVFIYVILGIIIFTVSLVLQMNSMINYIGMIKEGVDRIAQGDFQTEILVKGNDEFAIIAENLNKMMGEISELMDNEREVERSKNQLITNVAHDLRTPLTSIIGYMELLVNGNNIPEETRDKYLKVAYNKSLRLQKLIEDLFGFTKLNYGKIAMNIAKVDIVKLMAQLLEEFYPNFMENSLEYSLESTENQVMIEADGDLLARLFDNLINNAIKYGKDGKKVSVVIRKIDDIVHVAVINYGKVIPKEDIDKVFNKFYRVEQSRSANTGGTGLGLAIAKNIAMMHGGDIVVQSDLYGTIFDVTLSVNYNKEKYVYENRDLI